MHKFIDFCFWYIMLCFICDTSLLFIEANEVHEEKNPADLKEIPYSFKDMLANHFISHLFFLLSPLWLLCDLYYLAYDFVVNKFKK